MNQATSHDADAAVSLQTLLTIALREYAGFSERYASLVAADAARGMSAMRGGEMIYVPKLGAELRRDVRDELVRAMFNGTNLAEICAEFGISRASAYKIISRK